AVSLRAQDPEAEAVPLPVLEVRFEIRARGVCGTNAADELHDLRGLVHAVDVVEVHRAHALRDQTRRDESIERVHTPRVTQQRGERYSAVGSMRSNAPSSSSVTTYSKPSGPWRTSRIRWCRSPSKRSRRMSSSLSLSTTRSSPPVRGISPMRALPTNRLPFHAGILSPVYTVMPVGAIDGDHTTSGCSMPSVTGSAERRVPS